MISQGGPVVLAFRPTAGSQPERSATTSLDGFTRTLSSALRLGEPLAYSEKGRGGREGRRGRRGGWGEGRKGREEEGREREDGGRKGKRRGTEGEGEKQKEGVEKQQLERSVHKVLLYYRLIV